MIWVLVVSAVYLALILGLLVFSTRPMRTPAITSPGAFGAPQEDVAIRVNEKIELSAWWIDAPESEAVVVLAHGYFLSKGELASVSYMLWQRGISSLLFDFRAHGKSKGGTCSFGVHEKDDVKAAVRYAKSRMPGKKVILIGSSMGSVAGALAWSEEPDLLDGLVLDSAYGRLSKAVLGWWKFMGGPWLSVLLSPTVILGGPFLGANPFRIDVSEALEKLKGRPILLMHGAKDVLASPKEAERNLFALGPGAKAVWFEGCDHSEGRWEQPEKYRVSVFEFLNELGIFSEFSRTKQAK
ncbi:MAG: hypothetical protein BGO01_18565 [Armatimonadetes bacterium 55-13]|nr:alpha/beta fold hydrolase [Armatimonadota bacterium]OJU64134.1 MAG: hypothetical protein BGO01_18565 [Armatimonadetes bacterium 55-13]